MTEDLATAMHHLADSEQPPAMDVERVLREGRQSLVRRRTAALSGGTAALAVTGLAVAALAPAGSLGHRHTAPAVTAPAPATPTTPTTMRTLAPAVDPHDPIVTRYQFGWLPEGMRSTGGADAPDHRNQYSGSTDADSAYSDFRLYLTQVTPENATHSTGGGLFEHVPAVVPGATEAYWRSDGAGNIVDSASGDETATLVWHLPSGEWLWLMAWHLRDQPDWRAQTLKAAANVIRQDRTVPMPFKISGGLGTFQLSIASVSQASGETVSHLRLDVPGEPSVDILADDSRASVLAPDDTPTGYTKTCKDSHALKVCVSTPAIPPDALKAIGGPQGLLDRITSLGNDPANWTQDVLE